MNKWKKKAILLTLYSMLLMDMTGCSIEKDLFQNRSKEEVEDTDYNKEDTKKHAHNKIEEKKKQEKNKKASKHKKEEKREEIQKVFVKDADELASYLGYDEVSFSALRNAILENTNISSEDKNIIYECVNKIEEKLPFIDLKCFYENIKLLEIEKITKEEMSARGKQKRNGYFDAENHKIVVLKDGKMNAFTHEVLHLLNTLYLQKEDKVIIKNDNIDYVSSINEGFNEWLNVYLFSYDTCSYYEQVKDIDIIKNIMQEESAIFISNYITYGQKFIYNALRSYLEDDQIVALTKICEKEKENLLSYDFQNLLIDEEIENKYDILLQALIESRDGSLSQTDVFEMHNLLSSSYRYYELFDAPSLKKNSNRIEEFNKKYLQMLLNYGKDTNNTIKIEIKDGKYVDYYDINNLGIGYKQEGEDKFSIVVAENYKDYNDEGHSYVLEGKLDEDYTFLSVAEEIKYMNLENNYTTIYVIVSNYFSRNSFDDNTVEIEEKTYTYSK